jgi:hypothetical protein
MKLHVHETGVDLTLDENELVNIYHENRDDVTIITNIVTSSDTTAIEIKHAVSRVSKLETIYQSNLEARLTGIRNQLHWLNDKYNDADLRSAIAGLTDFINELES